jgi:phage gpG-like protein
MLTMTIERRQLDAKLAQLRSMSGAEKEKALQLASRQMVTFVKNTFSTSGANAGIQWAAVSRYGEGAGQPLMDAGTLHRSIAATVTPGRVVVGVAGPANAYARAQQEGYTVLPTHNKFAWVPGGPYLNIPMVKGPSKRRAFTLKDYPGWRAMILKDQPGLGWVAAIKKGKKWEPIAALRKRVKLKARPFLFWSVPLVADIRKMLDVYIKARLTRPTGGGN